MILTVTSPLEIFSKKRKRWLTTTIFSPFHIIMELCLLRIIIITFLSLSNRKLISTSMNWLYPTTIQSIP